MVQLLVIGAVFYLAVVVLMYALQRSFLYYPSRDLPSRMESGVASMDERYIRTADGLDLVAWSQPPGEPDKPWVVIFHGNAGTIAGRAFKARVFLDAGYGVLMPEYRGFGGNPGTPSEVGLLNDARAALKALADQGVVARKVVLYGESLGTGVAVAMAHEAAEKGQPVAAVVLEAPFTSAADVAADHYPFLPARLLLKDRFNSLARIQGIDAPLFVVHGARDRTVAQKRGRALFEAAREPKTALWIDRAGHNDLFDFGVDAALLSFLDQHND